MSGGCSVLLALLAALMACSPTTERAPANHTAGTSPSPEVSAPEDPSPSPLPDPAAFDRKNPVMPGFLPRAVAFLDDDHGVLGGRIQCGPPCAGGGTGILARTDDGGSTWRVTKRLSAPITHLTTIEGTRVVWATASRCDYFLDDCARRLLRSPNGGRTWAIEHASLLNPGFASASLGFAATGDVRGGSDHGPIAVTRDGGATWTRRPGPCRGWQNMPVAFSFASSSTGWLLCGSTDPGAGFFQFKAVYRTLDAGATWEPMSRSSPDGSLGRALPPNGGALGIQMFGDGTGFVWAGGGFAYLARTTDAGASWHSNWNDIDRSGSELSSMSWLDEMTGFAVRWQSSFGFDLVITQNGGRSWSSIERWPVRS